MLAGQIERPPSNGLAIAGLVCGIVGVVLGLLPWTFWAAWVLGVLAIVFSAIGRRKADREPAAGRRSMATAGLILGIVAIGLGIVGLIVLMSFFDDVGSTLDTIESCLGDPDALECQ